MQKMQTFLTATPHSHPARQKLCQLRALLVFELVYNGFNQQKDNSLLCRVRRSSPKETFGAESKALKIEKKIS